MSSSKVIFFRVLDILREKDENHPFTANQIVMGDATLHINIGWFYESGELGKVDLPKAVEWH